MLRDSWVGYTWLNDPGADNNILTSVYQKIQNSWDFLGGPVVKNLPCNAEGTGLIPDRGTKIPHTVGAAKPTYSRACAPVYHMKDLARCNVHGTVPCTATKTWCSQTNESLNIFKNTKK